MFIIGKGNLGLLLLFLPGFVFGVSMSIALKKYTNHPILIVLFSTIIYIISLYILKNFNDYLPFGRIIYGGLGAVLILFSIFLITKINFKFLDYILGFTLVILSTLLLLFFTFSPTITLLSITLWQISISWVINNRENKL
jgi:hypothetical protein